MARKEMSFVDGCLVETGHSRMGGELWLHPNFGGKGAPELILDKGRVGVPAAAGFSGGFPYFTNLRGNTVRTLDKR